MARLFEDSELFKYIRNAVFDDSYIFGTIHGPPRSSKSTIGLWAGQSVYENWDKTLQATVFNLSSVIQRMEDGKPEKWPTSNGMHSRVPFLLWDDFAVTANKAETQHSTAFDTFKGCFDVLGTSIGVLMLTMVDAGSATQQLQGKYNIEVFVTSKGKYKFDTVVWKQDYKGFNTIMKKHCVEFGEFAPIPPEIYKQYDAMRQDLNKQAFIRLKDAMALDTVDMLVKILQPDDIQLLSLIRQKGPVKYNIAKDTLGEKYQDTLTRCKARSLVIPTNIGSNHYRLDLSSIGIDVLKSLEKNGNAPKTGIDIQGFSPVSNQKQQQKP
jgi:hypothetical protein